MAGLKGGKWTGQLVFFSSDVDNPSNTSERKISSDDLEEKLQECKVDLEEEILDLTQWRSDLEGSSTSVGLYCTFRLNYYFYHEFVVFKTSRWWWSIEKNLQGIILQRRGAEDDVSKMLLNKARKNAVQAPMSDSTWFNANHRNATNLIKEGLKQKEQDVLRSPKIRDLVCWLQSGEHISHDGMYHFLLDNCQSFAHFFWDDLSKTGRLQKLLGVQDTGSTPFLLYKSIFLILTAASALLLPLPVHGAMYPGAVACRALAVCLRICAGEHMFLDVSSFFGYVPQWSITVVPRNVKQAILLFLFGIVVVIPFPPLFVHTLASRLMLIGLGICGDAVTAYALLYNVLLFSRCMLQASVYYDERVVRGFSSDQTTQTRLALDFSQTSVRHVSML